MNIVDLNEIERKPIQGHTSKGDQPKWQLNDRWYKADHMGYEALAEVVLSRLLQYSNAPDFVDYHPLWIQNEEKKIAGCVSKNFRGKDEMLIPLERLHRAYRGKGLASALAGMTDAQQRIGYTVDFVQKTTGLTDIGQYLTFLLELDGFFLNEDRHTNNLAVIRNEKTLEFRLCPIFDNGLALLSDQNDYPLGEDIYDCIAKVKAKPFDVDFDEQVDAAEALYGCQLKFMFNRQIVHDVLEELGELYPKEILHRVEWVIYEQMRKYQIYFE